MSEKNELFKKIIEDEILSISLKKQNNTLNNNEIAINNLFGHLAYNLANNINSILKIYVDYVNSKDKKSQKEEKKHVEKS